MKLRDIIQQLLEVEHKLGVPKTYICGGVPRDRYLKRLDIISDLDLTNGTKSISYLSEEFALKLKQKYNVTYKVMEDGHSTIFIGNLKIDFSSNFMLPNIINILDNMGIKNPTDMQKELFSRDFTCNALLLSMDLNTLTDPTNRGLKDIDNKKIVTCLEPNVTLVNNRNRVIRSIYLAAKLDFDIDESIINFVRQNPESIRIATPKVLKEKLNEAFNWDADKSSYFIGKMNLWNYIPITEKVYPYYMKVAK